MSAHDRKIAEQLSRDLASGRRGQPAAGGESEDECAALLSLAAELENIELPPPPGFEEELSRQLAEAQTGPRWTLLARVRAWMLPSPRRTAAGLRLTLGALAIGFLLLAIPRLGRLHTVSAADILTRAQHALASRIRPGEILFRRWRIVERLSDAGGRSGRVQVRYLDEWIDGSDIKHSVGKSLDVSGRMYLAYLRERAGDRYVTRVFYEPGFAGEPRGLLSIVPDQPEFESGAAQFSGHNRDLLQEFFRRGYGPYEPLMREFRYNQAALAAGTRNAVLAPVSISLEKPVRFDGESFYAVRTVEPVRVQFRWSSEGLPRVWLDRGESVRYVSTQTYLSQKIDTASVDESGNRVVATRRVVDMRVFRSGAERDPFTLDVPADTPVREQSAAAYLMGVAVALERAPAFQRAYAEPGERRSDARRP